MIERFFDDVAVISVICDDANGENEWKKEERISILLYEAPGYDDVDQ
jgi:hypothetical protein